MTLWWYLSLFSFILIEIWSQLLVAMACFLSIQNEVQAVCIKKLKWFHFENKYSIENTVDTLSTVQLVNFQLPWTYVCPNVQYSIRKQNTKEKKEKSVNCFSSDCMFQGPDLALYVYLSVILCVACTTNEFH